MTPGIWTREGSMYFKTLTRLHLWGHGNDSFCMSSVAADQENHVACSGSLSTPFWNRSPGIGYKNRFFSCDFWSWVSGAQTECVTYPQTQLKGTRTRGLGHKVASQLLWLTCICFTFPIQFSLPSQERTKHLDSKPLSSSLGVLDNKCFLFLKCFLKNCCQLWGWRGISMVIKRTCCSWRGSGFCFYHSCDGSQPSVTLVLGHSRPSYNFHGHQIHIWCRPNTHIK